MKQCTKCKEYLPLDKFHKHSSRADGLQSECIECRRFFNMDHNHNRMWVNGKYISQNHPLHKPGRFKTLDDAWSHTEIDERSTEGEVYIIRNMAWSGWYKVGKAVSSEDRLSGYQTSSPFRDYVLEYCEAFDNRHQAEAEIHRMLEKHPSCHERRGEWFKTYTATIKEVMNEYRTQKDGTGYRDEQCPQHDLALCNTGY